LLDARALLRFGARGILQDRKIDPYLTPEVIWREYLAVLVDERDDSIGSEATESRSFVAVSM